MKKILEVVAVSCHQVKLSEFKGKRRSSTRPTYKWVLWCTWEGYSLISAVPDKNNLLEDFKIKVGLITIAEIERICKTNIFDLGTLPDPLPNQQPIMDTNT